MLKDVPYATQYVLMPVSEPKVVIDVGDSRACGIGNPPFTFSHMLMNEMARVMTDEDVVGYGGVTGGRMMIIVNFPKEHCLKILDGALNAVNEIWKEMPELVPQGHINFDVRDWEDIPDEEKAGNAKANK